MHSINGCPFSDIPEKLTEHFFTEHTTRTNEQKDSHYMYQCHACNDKPYQENHLEDHIHSHTGDRPYACPSCNNNFLYKQHVAQHIKNIHSDYTPPTIQEKTPRKKHFSHQKPPTSSNPHKTIEQSKTSHPLIPSIKGTTTSLNTHTIQKSAKQKSPHNSEIENQDKKYSCPTEECDFEGTEEELAEHFLTEHAKRIGRSTTKKSAQPKRKKYIIEEEEDEENSDSENDDDDSDDDSFKQKRKK